MEAGNIKRFCETKTRFKKIMQKAGISRTDQGITLRIDNVGLDEGNLLLYYTVSLNKTTTAEKLEKVKKDSLQERWNLKQYMAWTTDFH